VLAIYQQEGTMITTRLYASGEAIIREDEPGDIAFVIEKGKVEVTRKAPGGRVRLAVLGVDETFGEMSMIDEKPRSATVTALEETLVREIHRDSFHALVREQPESALMLIRQLFERLREANARLAQAAPGVRPPDGHAGAGPSGGREGADGASSLSGAAGAMAAGAQEAAPQRENPVTRVTLEGLTPKAVASLPENPLAFTGFPFRVGRRSEDPLVNNHLSLADSPPWQISRHHLSFVLQEGRVGLVDRGSQLGASLNSVRIGGHDGTFGAVLLEESEDVLVLGSPASPYRYRLRVDRGNA
jgi:CRP-like cAMP-binding protein